MDRLCGAGGRRGAVVVLLLPPEQGAGGMVDDDDDNLGAKARVRSWQELHPAPQWRVEVVTEAGARARVLQQQAGVAPAAGPGPAVSSFLSLLQDRGRWEGRRKLDPEGARVALALGLLFAMRRQEGEGGKEGGVVVGVVAHVGTEKTAPLLQRSVGCMLLEEEEGKGEGATAPVRVIDEDGWGLGGQAVAAAAAAGALADLRGRSFVVEDWGQVEAWVEEWVEGR